MDEFNPLSIFDITEEWIEVSYGAFSYKVYPESCVAILAMVGPDELGCYTNDRKCKSCPVLVLPQRIPYDGKDIPVVGIEKYAIDCPCKQIQIPSNYVLCGEDCIMPYLRNNPPKFTKLSPALHGKLLSSDIAHPEILIESRFKTFKNVECQIRGILSREIYVNQPRLLLYADKPHADSISAPIPLTGALQKLPTYEPGTPVTITGLFTEADEFYVKDGILTRDNTDDISSDDDDVFW